MHAVIGLIALGFVSSKAGAADRLSVPVDVWDPPFNTTMQRTKSEYVGLEKAEKRWRLCVSIPHLKDPYWAAVNHGLIDQAKQLGIGLRLLEAGGYNNLDIQRRQITDCMASDADGLIVAAISHNGLDDILASIRASKRPVIDLVNGMNPRHVSARSAVDYFDLGHAAGTLLKSLHAGQTTPVKVGWFPGPQGPTWADRGDEGFRAAIADTSIRIVASARGDTGKAVQSKLVAEALDQHADLDYIVGTTVSATAAVSQLRRRGLEDKIKVLAYYYGPQGHRAIRRGSILAAPTDFQSLQARIAVDLAVRLLENRDPPRHVSPIVEVIDVDSIRGFDPSGSLPPRGFRPMFSINNW